MNDQSQNSVDDEPNPNPIQDINNGVGVEQAPVYVDNQTSSQDSAELEEPEFIWQASEYVHHHKGTMWYVLLVVAVLILIFIAIYFKMWLGIGVFLSAAAAIVVYANKPPRLLTYKLDAYSVTIETKTYPYKNFRSFSVLSDQEWHSIELEPTQRFMPRLTLLFTDDNFDTIVEHLMVHLPRTDREPDMVERLTRYLRF